MRKAFSTGQNLLKKNKNKHNQLRKAFLIDPLKTNNVMYHDSLTLSNCSKPILGFLKTYFDKPPDRTVEYRNYKKLDKGMCLYELDQELAKGTLYKYSNNQYDIFDNIFTKILDKHAAL